VFQKAVPMQDVHLTVTGPSKKTIQKHSTISSTGYLQDKLHTN